jgi:hypothetical protein
MSFPVVKEKSRGSTDNGEFEESLPGKTPYYYRLAMGFNASDEKRDCSAPWIVADLASSVKSRPLFGRGNDS